MLSRRLPSYSSFTSPHLRLATQLPVTSRRSFTSTPVPFANTKPSTDASVATDKYPDDKHATNKADKLDVQSEQAGKGKEARATDTGGHAAEQRDTRGSTEKAKKDHPEAPDVVIGMQDERGGKGH